MILATSHSRLCRVVTAFAFLCLVLSFARGVLAGSIAIKKDQPVRLCVTYVNNQLVILVNDLEVYNMKFLVDVEKDNPRNDCLDLSNLLNKGKNTVKVMGYNHTAYGLDDVWHFGYNINIDGDVDPEFSFEIENPAGKGNIGVVYEKNFVFERK